MKRLSVAALTAILTLLGMALAFDSDETIPIAAALGAEAQEAERQQAQEGAAEEPGAGGETAAAPGGFDTLLSLLESAGMLETLNQEGPYTLFAPTNAAFENLAEGQFDMLQSDADMLRTVLSLHVVEGAYTLNELQDAGTVRTLGGETLEVKLEADGLQVNNVSFAATDVDNSYANGVIHVVEEVILPAEMERAQEQSAEQDAEQDAGEGEDPEGDAP